MKELDNILVSFLVVAYNAATDIGDLFDSLLNQSYPLENVELILTDSNSDDDTKNIMRKFAELNKDKFKDIVLIDNPQRTLPCGINVSLPHVSGDVFIRVDAHAIIDERFIEENVRVISSGEYICGGTVESICVSKTKWSSAVNCAENSMFGGSFAAFRRADSERYVSTLAFGAYKKEIFDKVGNYNESLARTEDNDMHYRMKKAGYKFFYTPRIKSFRKTRATFMKLLRQKYLNGYWIGKTLKINPRCFSLYHFVPACFVLGILFTTILAFLGIWQLSALMWVLYAIFVVMNTAVEIVKDKKNLYLLLLPGLFLMLHLWYGVGTMTGYLNFKEGVK